MQSLYFISFCFCLNIFINKFDYLFVQLFKVKKKKYILKTFDWFKKKYIN